MGGAASYDRPAEIESKHFGAFLKALPSMEGKTVAVTGCTTGTGLICATTCAMRGATVILLNRPSKRADAAVDVVSKVATVGKVLSVPCDLSSFASVREAAALLSSEFAATGIDVLCNNAGVMACRDVATVDSCDIQMQTNHLSHFLLTNLLWPMLEIAAKRQGEARVVNHSSVARKGKRLAAKNLGKNGGHLGGDLTVVPFAGPRWSRYQQTKLANVVFTYALHDRCQAAGSGVKALVAHPGVAATQLQVYTVADGGAPALLSKAVVSQSAEDGSMGILRCCCAPDAKSGDFYGPRGWAGKAVLMPAERRADRKSRDMLWAESERTTGARFTIMGRAPAEGV